MAFEFNNRVIALPETTEDIYLVPYAWFKYGIEHGYLTIESPKFYDSLQGSLILECGEHYHSTRLTTTKSRKTGDIWLVYTSGTGKVGLVLACDGYKVVNRPGRKPSKIDVMSLDSISALTPVEQKKISKQYIALFSGCGVKLKQSVWFF